MEINIVQAKRRSAKTKKFEEAEWLNADFEHYGKARPFSKKYYKFVAYNKNNVVGVLDLVIEANVAYIENVLVSSIERNKGIGKALLKYAEQFSKENNCSKIWLDTEEGWGAIEFYKKSGYAITGVHERHYLGNKGLIFTKFLE